MRADISLHEFGQQWKEVRAELIHRGYEVTEWFCDATRQHKARCVLQQNNQASDEAGRLWEFDASALACDLRPHDERPIFGKAKTIMDCPKCGEFRGRGHTCKQNT